MLSIVTSYRWSLCKNQERERKNANNFIRLVLWIECDKATYFRRNSRYIARLVRHDQSMGVQLSNRLMVHRAMSCDPNDTNGNCIGIQSADPNTRMIGTRIPFQFRRLSGRLVRMSLAILCRYNSGGRHIGPPFHQKRRFLVFDRHGCAYTLGQVSNTNFRNNRFLHKINGQCLSD